MSGAAPARRTIRFAHTSAGELCDPAELAAPAPVSRSWAWGGATGRGVRVCVVDSGVTAGHPQIGGDVRQLAAVRAAEPAPDGTRPWSVAEDTGGDVAGHGTACAGIVRSLAPDCELTSVRVLGGNLQGNGDALLTALEWAVAERFALINVSLSTRREHFKERLHDLADEAWFAGVTLISAAHNSPVDSYPWRFPSVISVGAHAVADPERVESNPARRWTSSPSASTCPRPGSAAPPGGSPATASPPRTSPGSAHASCNATRASAPRSCGTS